MSKCVACDCFLTDTELMMTLPDGQQESMCHYCRGIAFNPDSCEAKEYQFQSLAEFEFIGYVDKEEDSY